jgi:hypothetical protein
MRKYSNEIRGLNGGEKSNTHDAIFDNLVAILQNENQCNSLKLQMNHSQKISQE